MASARPWKAFISTGRDGRRELAYQGDVVEYLVHSLNHRVDIRTGREEPDGP